MHGESKRVQVIRKVASGMFIATACRLVGVGRTQFYEWKKSERFRTKLRKAEAEAMERALLTIQIAAKDDWRAAEAFAKLRWRKRFGAISPQFTVQNRIANVIGIESGLEGKSPEDLVRILRLRADAIERLLAAPQADVVLPLTSAANGSEASNGSNGHAPATP